MFLFTFYFFFPALVFHFFTLCFFFFFFFSSFSFSLETLAAALHHPGSTLYSLTTPLQKKRNPTNGTSSTFPILDL